MSTPESTTESAAETPAATTNGDGRDAVTPSSTETPVATQAPESAKPWWKRLLGSG